MPEDKTELTAEEQMTQLLEKLAGHEIFSRLRGRLHRSGMDLVDACREGASPTKARDRAQRLGNDLTWMAGLLARLERDGHVVALGELKEALRNPGHQMLYETTPIQSTVPLTVLVARPDVVLPLMPWIWAGRRNTDEFRLAFNGRPSADGQEAHPGVAATYRKLPLQAQEIYRTESPNDAMVMREMMEAYGGLWEPLLSDVAIRTIAARPKDDPSPWLLKELVGTCWENGRLSGGPPFHPTLAMAFRMSQKELLSLIDRSDQRDVATWQIDLPKVYEHDPDVAFGFHQEHEHAHWKRCYPGLVSHGLQAGYGVVAIPHPLQDYELDPYRTPNGEYVRFVLHNLYAVNVGR